MKIKRIDEMDCVNESNANECLHIAEMDINDLENGEYEGYRYDYWFELKNGFKFKMETGVKVSKKFAPLKLYRVENGMVTEI